MKTVSKLSNAVVLLAIALFALKQSMHIIEIRNTSGVTDGEIYKIVESKSKVWEQKEKEDSDSSQWRK